MDASVRRCKWTEASEKTYLRFVRSQSHFQRFKTSHSHLKNLTSNGSKQVSPISRKNAVNREQVEAQKWICVRFILVSKTSGEQISCEQRLKASWSDFKCQSNRKYAVSALQVISSTLADSPSSLALNSFSTLRHWFSVSSIATMRRKAMERQGKWVRSLEMLKNVSLALLKSAAHLRWKGGFRGGSMKHHGNKKREWTACQQLKRQVREPGVPGSHPLQSSVFFLHEWRRCVCRLRTSHLSRVSRELQARLQPIRGRNNTKQAPKKPNTNKTNTNKERGATCSATRGAR